MFVHRYGMAGAADPPKHPLGDNGNAPPIHGSGGKGKGPATWSTWEVLWEDTEQSDPHGMSWMDPCQAGSLPSASGCSSPSKHGEDPRKTQSWKPLLTATTHSRSCCCRLRRSGSCSLPPEWFIAGLLGPPHLISDTTEAFSHFYRKNFFKKRQPGGLGFGWLVVMVWTLEFDSEVLKFRVDQKNRDIKTPRKQKKSVSRK